MLPSGQRHSADVPGTSHRKVLRTFPGRSGVTQIDIPQRTFYECPEIAFQGPSAKALQRTFCECPEIAFQGPSTKALQRTFWECPEISFQGPSAKALARCANHLPRTLHSTVSVLVEKQRKVFKANC